MIGELEEDVAGGGDVGWVEGDGYGVGDAGLKGVVIGEDDSLQEIEGDCWLWGLKYEHHCDE